MHLIPKSQSVLKNQYSSVVCCELYTHEKGDPQSTRTKKSEPKVIATGFCFTINDLY